MQLREKESKERVGGEEERPRRTGVFICSVLIMSRLLDVRDRHGRRPCERIGEKVPYEPFGTKRTTADTDRNTIQKNKIK